MSCSLKNEKYLVTQYFETKLSAKKVNSPACSYKWNFFKKRKNENLQLYNLALKLYGIILNKPSSEEWHGCHSKNT